MREMEKPAQVCPYQSVSTRKGSCDYAMKKFKLLLNENLVLCLYRPKKNFESYINLNINSKIPS